MTGSMGGFYKKKPVIKGPDSSTKIETKSVTKGENFGEMVPT